MTLRTNRGNILFLILLAVVLFAALSYAVTSSMRGGGRDASNEGAMAAASDMLGWLKQVDQAVMRMMLVGNVPIEKIDFYDPNNLRQGGTTATEDNTHCAEESCRVFSAEGGGATARHFEKYANMSADTGNVSLRKPGHRTTIALNIRDLGTHLNDIGFRINYISLPVCKAINRQMSLPDCPDGTMTGDLATFYGNLSSVQTALSTPTAYALASEDIKGRTTFCICGASSGHVFHIVIER